MDRCIKGTCSQTQPEECECVCVLNSRTTWSVVITNNRLGVLLRLRQDTRRKTSALEQGT